jgi:formylglycine-generating enzyme required for sulfatase activity/CHAT domain-containing protein
LPVAVLPDAQDLERDLELAGVVLPGRVREEGPLGDRDKLLRALAPLLRRQPDPSRMRFDEERTVEHYAQTRLLQPQHKPSQGPAFDEVLLVLDGGVSMQVWRPQAEELQRVLASTQVFPRVRLKALEPGPVERARDRTARQKAAERLSGVVRPLPGSRPLLLLLSDTAGRHWWDGRMFAVLEQWGRICPTAILHPLPLWLWNRTALAAVERVSVRNSSPAAANPRYRAEALNWWEKPLPPGRDLPFPVLLLEREALGIWSAVVMGNPAFATAGVALLPFAQREQRRLQLLGDRDLSAPTPAPAPLTTEEAMSRWEAFQAMASPQAQQLLEVMASSPLLTLPVMRLLKAAKLPEVASSLPIAEVLTSGLVARKQERYEQLPDPRKPPGKPLRTEHIQFEVLPEVAALLLERLPATERRDVISRVSALVERRWNSLYCGEPSFEAVLCDPTVPPPKGAEGVIQFASVTARLLDTLPGEEAKAFAERIRQGSALPPASPWPSSMVFDDVEFESAQLVDVPPLETIPFTSARFVEVELRRIGFVGVASLLLGPMSTTERRDVILRVCSLVESRWNSEIGVPSFETVMRDPAATSPEGMEKAVVQFASAMASLLDTLPGDESRAFAERIRRGNSLQPNPDRFDVVSALTGDGADGTSNNSTIHYTMGTRRARTEMRAQTSQRRLVEQLVAQASNGNNTDRTIGQTLFKLLVPIEMQAALEGLSTVLLVLDQGSAPIPWEMLEFESGTSPDELPLPWAIRSKLIRKLKMEDFRQQPRDASLNNGVLVIGEPDCTAPRLPGARREARAVEEKLKSVFGDEQVYSLIASEEKGTTGPKAIDIIYKLLERNWRIVHISGHGMLPDGEDPRGVVLSDDLYLGPREINTMRVVPELVFVNCCHLAATNQERLLELPFNRAKFAARLAEQLLQNGVRCVVAAGWAVSDQGAELFASRFYEALLHGQRFIDAITTARLTVFENAAAGDNTWAAYQCYGDPDWVLKTDAADPEPLQQQGFVPSIGNAWAFHDPLQRDHLPFGATAEKADPLALTLVEIPAGTFQMGSPPDEPERSADEGPQHEVSLQSFFISQTPITQAQWRQVAQWSEQPGEHWGRELKPNPSHFSDQPASDQRPVERVSWHDAMEFCNRLSQRTGRHYTLPSEAQWEYACRAGSKTPFAFGETFTAQLANYNGNYTYANSPEGASREQTTPVGMFPANAWGLQDMHGNVWEWCLDHWHESYEGAPEDGRAWLSEEGGGRLLRGGSWSSNPWNCRSADRILSVPVGAFNFFGFRVVCLPQGPSLNP